MQHLSAILQLAAETDAVARFILFVLLFMSLGTWYLIVAKGLRLYRAGRRSRAFLRDFWRADSLDEVARRVGETGVTEPFSHLVHHGFSAVAHHEAGRTSRGLVDAGTPDEFITRALKRAIAQDRARLEQGQTFLATVASSAPFVGLFGTVWGIYHARAAIWVFLGFTGLWLWWKSQTRRRDAALGKLAAGAARG